MKKATCAAAPSSLEIPANSKGDFMSDPLSGSEYTREAFRFFQRRAGIVGRAAVAGLNLARAEAALQAREWRVDWESDDCANLSDISDDCFRCKALAHAETHDPENAAEFQHDHECYVAVLRDSDGKVRGSLGGIWDPDRDFIRDTEAGLMSDALSEEETARKEAAALRADLDSMIVGARTHGSMLGEKHAIADLEAMLRDCWAVMTTAQQAKVRDQHRDMITWATV
jgi:hypothetical protein